MTNKIILQKLQETFDTEIALAQKYYSFIFEINSLGITDREIQLVAFTAVRGNISNANVREEFCKTHDTSVATINNIISKLKKFKIFIKEGSKVKVNPAIVIDFKKDVVLYIELKHEPTS